MLGQGGAHLTEIPALHQGQAVLHHFAALPQADQTLGGKARAHAVLAAVQWLAFEVEAPVQTQPECIVEHAVGFQTIEGARRRSASGYVEQLLLRQLQGLLEGRVEFPGRKAHEQSRRDQADLQQ